MKPGDRVRKRTGSMLGKILVKRTSQFGTKVTVTWDDGTTTREAISDLQAVHRLDDHNKEKQ